MSDAGFPKVHKTVTTGGVETVVHQMAAVTTWSSQDYCASMNQRHQLGTSPPPLVIRTSPMFASSAILCPSPVLSFLQL